MCRSIELGRVPEIASRTVSSCKIGGGLENRSTRVTFPVEDTTLFLQLAGISSTGYRIDSAEIQRRLVDNLCEYSWRP